MNARVLMLTLVLVLSTFSAVFTPQQSFGLNEERYPQLAGNTVDCGINAANVSFEVEAYQPVWNRHDTVSAFLDTYCGVWNNTYRVDWTLFSLTNSTVMDTGQNLFETNSSSVTYHPNHTDHFNEIDVHFHYMETGNYSISGDFYVLVNTTWTWLANVSDSFQVNSTNSTTACGYNDTLLAMDTPPASSSFPYYVGGSVYPWVDVECPVFGTPYVFAWELYNQNTSTLTQMSWANFTATWQNVHLFNDGSGVYHDINLALHNLSEGVYVLSTGLTLTNGTALGMYNFTFEVWGNATGGGNQTNTGCGYDVNYTMLMAYTSSWMYEGDEFVSWINTYCDVINTSMWYEAYILDAAQNMVANTTVYWTPSTNAGISETWNVTGLSAGSYTFEAILYAWSGGSITVETDTVGFTVVAQSSASPELNIDTNNATYSAGDTVIALLEAINLTAGETYLLQWYVLDGNQTVDQGNVTWTSPLNWLNHSVNITGLSAGSFCFYGSLYHVDANGTSTWLDMEDTCFVVGGGSSSNPNSGCGFDWWEVEVEASLSAMAPSTLENVTLTLDFDCLIVGEAMLIHYELVWSPSDNGTNGSWQLVDQGNVSWTAAGLTHSIDFGWSQLQSGTYTASMDMSIFVNGSWVQLTVDSMSFSVVFYDADNDGVVDDLDNCPFVANTNQTDFDGDGVGDFCDWDLDGDGSNNTDDHFPVDPAEWMDTDGDGVGNNADLDDDNDGVADPNDSFPTDPSEQVDTDGDGIGDNADADDDNDGVLDISDNCPLVNNSDQTDLDGDGIGAACDPNDATTNNGNSTTNTPPVVTSVAIDPASPSTNDVLTCSYTAYDMDGDAVSTSVGWSVNGNTVPSSGYTLSGGFASGDEVICIVSGSDGQASSSASSIPVFINGTDSEPVDDGGFLPSVGIVATIMVGLLAVVTVRRDER